MKSLTKYPFPILTALAAAALVSCSSTGNLASSRVSPSGFLNHFSQLDAGYGTEDAFCAYLKPGVDFKKYDSVIIDPVNTIIQTPGIQPEVAAQLAAYLDHSLAAEIGGKMKIVSTPGPTTLRVRTALTDAIQSHPSAEKAATTVHYAPKAVLSGNLGSPAVAAFISQVSFEGEIVDSTTNERLSALCDHRLGAKREANPTTSWSAIRNATRLGAAKLYKRFETAKAL